MHQLYWLSAVGLTLVACSRPTVTLRPASAPFDAVELAADVARLRSSFVEGHAALNRFRRPREIDSIFHALEDSVRVPRTALAFWKLASVAVAGFRDDHASVLPSEVITEALYRAPGAALPMRFAIIDHRPFVLRNYAGDAGPPAGSEVLTVNGRPAREFLDECARVVSTDGDVETRAVRKIERDFELTCALAHDMPAVYRLAIRTPGGESLAVDVKSVPWRERRALLRATAPRDTVIPPPAQLSFHDDSSIAVLSLPAAFSKANGFDADDFLEKSFRRVRAARARALVLDLRGNTGGTDGYAGNLFTRIARDTFTYYTQRHVNKRRFDFLKGTDDWTLNYAFLLRFRSFSKSSDGRYALRLPMDKVMQPRDDAFRGPVFLLIDGNSVSTSSEFASVFKARGRGTILGEESGSALVGGSGASVSVVLPNTRVVVNVPIMTAYIAPRAGSTDAPARGVFPDMYIVPTLAERLSGADPVLDRALQNARDVRP